MIPRVCDSGYAVSHAGIAVWDWIPLLSNEAFTYQCYFPQIIVQL